MRVGTINLTAESLKPKELVTLDELALSNMWETAALVELLKRKGMHTNTGLRGGERPGVPASARGRTTDTVRQARHLAPTRMRRANSTTRLMGCAVVLSGTLGVSTITEGHTAATPHDDDFPRTADVVGVGLSKPGPRCKNERVNLPAVKVSPLQPAQDLGQHAEPGRAERPRLIVTARVRRLGSQLILTGAITLSEDPEDGTTLQGEYEVAVSIAHVLAPGCRYHAVDLRGQLRANEGERTQEWTTYTGMDIIRAAQCGAVPKGTDRGKWGCTIFFRPIKVKAHDGQE